VTKCMDCGAEIDCLREAPSGSMLPRCGDCAAKRWSEYSRQCADKRSAVGSGYPRGASEPDPLEDPWG